MFGAYYLLACFLLPENLGQINTYMHISGLNKLLLGHRALLQTVHEFALFPHLQK